MSVQGVDAVACTDQQDGLAGQCAHCKGGRVSCWVEPYGPKRK